MTLKHWDDAKNDVWIDPADREKLDEDEQQRYGHLKIAYVPAKSKWLVPVMLPEDTYSALDRLVELRHTVGNISQRNQNLFAAGRGSMLPVIGRFFLLVCICFL
jgi:hypothetical protein